VKVAIIGGGIFGCTTAIHASRLGHDVHLFERGSEILGAASAVNQFRLHKGYHYPRSHETAKECKATEASFRAEYGECVIDGSTIYAIADGSRTSAVDYLSFCVAHDLPFRAASAPFDTSSLSIAIESVEGRIDPVKLRELIAGRLGGIKIYLRTPATLALRDRFNIIVIAAYASTNEVALALDCAVEPFQYEVIEKPVLRLPRRYKSFSMVVMDGEFCSLDPYGETGLHLMGHVKHAIHSTNTGLEPEVPEHLAGYLNRGIIEKPEGSRIAEFVESGSKYIPVLSKAEHVGSMFTVRAVLPERDATDERPTLVEALDGQVIRIFSGKIGTCVHAANKVIDMISKEVHLGPVMQVVAA